MEVWLGLVHPVPRMEDKYSLVRPNHLLTVPDVLMDGIEIFIDPLMAWWDKEVFQSVSWQQSLPVANQVKITFVLGVKSTLKVFSDCASRSGDSASTTLLGSVL